MTIPTNPDVTQPRFLEIQTKVDSPEKNAYMEGKQANLFLNADEQNLIVEKVNEVNSKLNIVPNGTFQVFKRGDNTSNGIEINDFVKGILEGIYFEALYKGGDLNVFESYEILTQTQF